MKISEDTNVQLDLKTIGMIIGGAVMLAGTYFTLQAQIQVAMEEPKPEVQKIKPAINKKNRITVYKQQPKI